MLKQCLGWWVLVFACFLGLAFAQPLPPDQAFSVKVSVAANGRDVETHWQVAPGYHLYANKMQVNIVPAVPYQPAFPSPTTDGFYDGQFDIPVAVYPDKPGNYAFTVRYQGCALAGFCYPPTNKTVMLHLAPDATSSDISNLLINQYTVQSVLSQQSLFMLLLIFFGLGVLLAFTPCVLPMLPILTGIIVGQKKHATTKRAFLLSLTYVLGMALAYSFAGMLAAVAGSSLQVIVQQPIFIIAGSLLFVLLALSLFEFYTLPISSRWQTLIQRWSMKHEGGTYVGVFFMGLIATLLVSPCVTAPLVGVLLYISQTGNVLLGSLALFVLGLGMGLPLILVGMSAGRWMPKRGPWMLVITKCFGLLMLAMAIWLVDRILPEMVIYSLWLIYAIFVLVFFLFFFPAAALKKLGRTRLCLILVLIFTVMFLMGGLEGVSTFVEQALGVKKITQPNHLKFTTVNNRMELKATMVKAAAEHKPVILDFYADWCESCIDMDKTVFSSNAVRRALHSFVLLRVDLSANGEASHAMMKMFEVIAPPTILFFNPAGVELTKDRMVGEVSEAEFLNRLPRFTPPQGNP
jgi:thiol:disulfide interchange protein DsbD